MLIATQHTGEQRWRCRESCVPKQKRVYIAYSASVETVSNEMKNFIYGKYGLLLVSIYIVLLVCGNWQQRRSVYESDIRKVKWAVTAKKKKHSRTQTHRCSVMQTHPAHEHEMRNISNNRPTKTKTNIPIAVRWYYVYVRYTSYTNGFYI